MRRCGTSAVVGRKVALQPYFTYLGSQLYNLLEILMDIQCTIPRKLEAEDFLGGYIHKETYIAESLSPNRHGQIIANGGQPGAPSLAASHG